MAFLVIICLKTSILVKSLFTEKKQELTKIDIGQKHQQIQKIIREKTTSTKREVLQFAAINIVSNHSVRWKVTILNNFKLLIGTTVQV